MPRKLDLSDAELTSASWFSAGEPDTPNRVEVAPVGGGMAMRDSDHPDGPVLLFTKAEWDAFVAGVRGGEFDIAGPYLAAPYLVGPNAAGEMVRGDHGPHA